MKILFLTDTYAWDVFGVKRSLYETLASLFDVTLRYFHNDHRKARFGPSQERMPAGAIYDEASSGGFTHIFFASSGLAFELPLMEALRERAVLVGFGFSDPRFFEFSREHWHLFDAYFSLEHEVTALAEEEGLAAGTMLPSIHAGFHDMYRCRGDQANYDVVYVGNLDDHPDAPRRRSVVDDLRWRGLRVITIGKGGDTGHVEGEEFVRLIADARIGLNMMNPNSTLPHKLFEYAAVGLCLVSTPGPQIDQAFEPNLQYLPLTEGVWDRLLADPDLCSKVAEAGRLRCIVDHTMEQRAEDIIRKLKSIPMRSEEK
jgi:hypothetical protein